MKTVLCYGDSNTWGYIGNSGERFPFRVRWTGRISMALGKNYHIIEEGLSGRTTTYDLPLEPKRNGYSSLRVALESADPIDLVILMLGTNDRRKQLRVSPRESAMALERYIQYIRTPVFWSGHWVPEILIVSPPEILESVTETQDNIYYDMNSVRDSIETRSVYRELADRYGCGFLDAAAYAVPGEDFIHMTESGHKALADAVVSKIREML